MVASDELLLRSASDERVRRGREVRGVVRAPGTLHAPAAGVGLIFEEPVLVVVRRVTLKTAADHRQVLAVGELGGGGGLRGGAVERPGGGPDDEIEAEAAGPGKGGA